MLRNNDSQGFERKSHFNNDRGSYVDENGNYVYSQWVKRPNGKWEREIIDIVPLTAENRDVIILLDEYDHDNDLQERYDEENADYGIRNQHDNHHGDSEDEDSFDADPLENIADPSGDVFDQLYPEEMPVDPKVAQAEAFIHEQLKPEQQDMVYGHLGEMKYLEDIRREEEAATGKKVTKQAVHGRWDRIITKACKEFGVEKPKQEHKKHSKE